MSGRDQLTQNRVTRMHASFEPSHNEGFEALEFDTLSESDKEFLKILANLYESVENTNIESLNTVTRIYAKQLFSLYNKKSSEVEQLGRQYKLQRKGVEELNIMIEQHKVANDELKRINQKNYLEYQKQLGEFEDIRKLWENSKKELQQARRKNQEQTQKIRLLNQELEIQKEVISSLEKKINSLDSQVSDLKKNAIQLQHDKYRLEKELQILNQQLSNLTNPVIENLGQQHNKEIFQCFSVFEDNQSVYSKVSTNKYKDNVDILNEAQKKNSFDRLSRRSSIEVDNQDYELDINIQKKSSNIPQYSERQMVQPKKNKYGKIGSTVDCFKQKKNINQPKNKNTAKVSEKNGTMIYKQPQQKRQKLMNENLLKKDKQFEQINKLFELYRSENQTKYDLKCREMAKLQDQLQLQIEDLKATVEHEKTVSNKFMKQNIELKLKNSRLVETSKQLQAEKEEVSRYYTQKLQNMIRVKSNYMNEFNIDFEELTKQIKTGSNKKTTFFNCKNLKRQNTNPGKLQSFDSEDVFKDQPTKQTRLSKNITSQDLNGQILSEIQFSLTLDEDSKQSYKENGEDNKNNQKTASQTPNKQIQSICVQTDSGYFLPFNLSNQIGVQTQTETAQKNIQFHAFTNEAQIQISPTLSQIQIQTELVELGSHQTQTFYLINSINQTQGYMVQQISSQTEAPIFQSVCTQAKINFETQYTQVNVDKKQFNHGVEYFYASNEFIQTDKLQSKEYSMQTLKIRLQNKQNQTFCIENISQYQQTQESFKLKKQSISIAIQPQFQDFSNVFIQTDQEYKKLLSKKDNYEQFETKRIQILVTQGTQTELHFQLYDFNLQTQTGFGKIPLTEEEFLSIQTKTKSSKIDAQSIASSQEFHQKIDQRQQPAKWTFYNPQSMNKNFFQERMQIKPLKMQKSRGPRLPSKSHRVQKDQSSSLIIDVNENDCKQLPPERILEKMIPKPIGSIMFLQKTQQINNKFKWNKDKYYMLEAQSQKDGTKEKFLIWKKGIFSMYSRKYLKLKMTGLCLADPEMINIGNSEIVLRGQQLLIRKKQKNGYVTGGLENGTWKIINCSLYDSRK